jgi:hypothetical protein
LDYQEIIDRRRALTIEPYKSLAEIGFDGPWVTPYQITSKSSEGPVLVALRWLDESSILRERPTLQDLGYLPNIRFNTVIDAALARQGLNRKSNSCLVLETNLANLRGELAMERACNELGNLPAHNRKTRGVASP